MSNLVKLVCPQCKTHLSFELGSDMGNKLIVCPKCRFRATVGVYLSGAAGTGGKGTVEDMFAAKQLNVEATVPGCLRLQQTGKIFLLKSGINVIGRIAKSGNADIQLSEDVYMSRRHIEIHTQQTATGWEYRLVEINSKNEVLLNGCPLSRGETVVLKFGDTLVLGKTDVLFDRQEDEEETKSR